MCLYISKCVHNLIDIICLYVRDNIYVCDCVFVSHKQPNFLKLKFNK